MALIEVAARLKSLKEKDEACATAGHSNCPTDAEITAQQQRADAATATYAQAIRTHDRAAVADAIAAANVERSRLGQMQAACKKAAQKKAEDTQQRTNEEDAAADAKIKNNPKAVRMALSLNLCMVRQVEQTALASIKTEKANARIAGVVSLGALRGFQDKVVEARQMIAAYRSDLKANKVGAMPCDNKDLLGFWACSSDPDNSNCKEVVEQALLRLRVALDRDPAITTQQDEGN
jgi:hypothetical protein